MRPTADSRSCRSQARWTGVCPEGAQVRRRTGWSMKPLSSKKTIGLPQRLAPFLSAANPASATAPWPRRLLLGPVVRASGRSIPGRGAFSRRDPGDTPRGTSWRSPRLPDGRSKGRWGIPPSVARPRGSRSGAAFASRSNGACGQDVVWLVTPPGLLSPQPGATVSPKTPKHQRFPPPRRHRRPPAANALPAVGEPPMRLRFLSVSYLTIRMSTTLGSLALQGSIIQFSLLAALLAPAVFAVVYVVAIGDAGLHDRLLTSFLWYGLFCTACAGILVCRALARQPRPADPATAEAPPPKADC